MNKLIRIIFYLFSFLLIYTVIHSQTEQEYLTKAKAAYQSKNYQSAINNYQKALELNPNNYEIYMHIAGTYMVQQELENFQSTLLEGIKVNPDYDEFYFFFGQGSALMDDPESAVEIFKELKNENTNWAALCIGISSVYERMGDLEEAIKYLEIGLRDSKRAHEIYTHMAKLYSDYKGDYMKAFHYLELALASDPTYPKAYFELGQIYGYQSEWMKAKEFYEKAIIYDSEYAAAYYNLGVCYGNLGEDLLATEYIKKAANLGDQDALEFLKINKIK